MREAVFPRTLGATLLAFLLVAISVVVIAPGVGASGATAFEIDGNTVGPDDWEGLDPDYHIVSTSDLCGNGVAESMIKAGTKLDDVWVFDTGQVLQKGDLCNIWTGWELDQTSGDVFFYFGWLRDANDGEVNIYLPLDGDPLGNRTGDLLVKFEFEDNTKEIFVETLSWNGSSWIIDSVLAPSVYDFDVSDDTLFGEVQINLSAAGIIPRDECRSLVGSFVITETGQGGQAPNPTLKDRVDLGQPIEFNSCGNIIVEKVTDGGVGTFSFLSGSLPGGPFDLSTTGEGVAASVLFPDLQPGTYDVAEALPLAEGWTFDGATCTGDENPAAIELEINETVTCTFRNSYTPAAAKLTVEKVVDTANAPAQSFDFTVTGQAGFSLADNGSKSFDFEFPAGESLDVTAAELAGLPVGWSFESVTCTGSDGPSASPSALVTLTNGADVTCTFHNSYTPAAAKLTVEKVVDTANAPAESFDFTVTDQAGFSLADGEWKSFDYSFAAGTVINVAAEELSSLPVGWSFVSVSCVDAADAPIGTPNGSSVAVPLANSADVTCTFHNSYTPAAAKLTVEKVVDTANAPAQSFDFTVTGQAGFSLADNGSKSFDFEFPAGESLDVTAAELAGLPVGWSFESVTCTGSDGPSASPSALVTLTNGADVTCTFHNSYTPAAAKLTVEKVVDTANAPAESFDFTVTDQAGFSLADGEWKSFDYSFAAGTVINVAAEELSSLPVGWSFVSVSCVDAADAPIGTPNGSSVAVPLANSADVTCTFHNSYTPAAAKLTVEKVVDTANAPAQSFDFTVTGQAGFSLADNGSKSFDFEFPAGESLDVTAAELAGLPVGWSFESVTCTGSDGPSASPSALVTLTNGADVTCTFHNSYTPAAAKLTVEKVVDTANAPAESFDFTVTDQAGFSLADGEWKSFDYSFAAGQSVEVTAEELVANLPARWSFVSVTCTGQEIASSSASAVVTLTNGADITCTFHNKYTPTTTTTPTTPPTLGSIGDLVWEDRNANGVQDLPTEPGVPGVLVELFDADTDTLLGIRVTDEGGHYSFDNLEAGSYYLVFTLPSADDDFIAPNVGDNPAIDSDADNAVNIGRTTSVITLVAGEDLTWDAGVAQVAVAGVQITTTTPETLPFTGANIGEGGMAGIALALLALGGVALLSVRRREELTEVVATGWSGRLWDVE